MQTAADCLALQRLLLTMSWGTMEEGLRGPSASEKDLLAWTSNNNGLPDRTHSLS